MQGARWRQPQKHLVEKNIPKDKKQSNTLAKNEITNYIFKGISKDFKMRIPQTLKETF